MADGGLLLIYRSLTTEELLELKQTMLDQMLSMKDYTSMTAGNKSFTRDMRQLTAQLEAITFVLAERSGAYEGVMVTDFTGKGSAPRAGTQESLNY